MLQRLLRPKVQRVVSVLGMHRSGTSCLTGSLEEAGVFLGEVFTKNPYNLKGNRENKGIMALNEGLLKAAGGSWDDPPRSVVWSDEDRRTRDRIVAGYRRRRCWGFKDPRTLFTLDGWLEALPDLRLVGIFRHPLSVAASLQHRNGFAVERGLDLWYRYNERLLACQARHGFPLISFDAPDDELRGKIALAIQYLDLDADPARLGFFDPGLRHAGVPDSATLPGPVEQLYRRLQDLAA